MRSLCKFICTLNLPIDYAQGTFGSIIGLAIFLFMRQLSYVQSLFIFLLIFLVGFTSIIIYNPKSDRKEIVIDEVIGQIISFQISELIFYYCSYSVDNIFMFLLFNFALFRLFDITKPMPIILVQNNLKNHIGIMLDDILAAFYSGLLTAIIIIISN